MRSLTWNQMRVDALRYPCVYCHQPIGEPCINRNGFELERQPAHLKRLISAGYLSMAVI